MISRRRISSIFAVPFKRHFSDLPNPKHQNPLLITNFNGDSQLTTFAFCSDALKDSAKRGIVSRAKQLHSHVMKLGFHGALSVQNQILHAYVKCGEYCGARQLFDEMPVKNVVSWNTVICGGVSCGRGFVYFRRMLVERAKPDCLTLNGLIRASIELNELALGNQLHCLVVKWGFVSNSFVGCALINLYGAFCLVDEAWSIFDGIKCRDLVLWNVMVSCYGVNYLSEDALRVFRLMCIEGFRGDEFTFSSLLSSCARPGYCESGKQFHGVVIKFSFDSDVQVVSAVVDMYAKNEEIIDARKVFDGIVVRNVVSWNTMIVGYGQHGHGKEAMKLLVQMMGKSLDPDELTLASIISSCGNLTFFNEVAETHCYAVKSGFETHISIANALIVAYSKCGNFESALKSFQSVKEPNLITWTSILGAYGFHGRAMESIETFEMMLSVGVRPDDLAFLAVISSCSHGGLTSKGLHYFKLMISDYGIIPRPEHYACLVDLLGRAVLIDEALTILTSWPVTLDPNTLGALFGACKLHGHTKLAEWIAEKLFELQPESPVNYTLMSNIYASVGHWYEAAMTREILSDARLHKHPGCSWIGNPGTDHTFMSTSTIDPSPSYGGVT